MRIAERMIVDAPPKVVWEGIADPTRWPRDLGRMYCSHVTGSPDHGPGARYWLHVEVGAAEVGSEIEVLEYEPLNAFSWATIRGLEQRGHWRLRDRGDGSTEVTLGVSYQASGGLAALVTDEISSVFVRRYVRDSLSALARRVECAAGGAHAHENAALLGHGPRLLGDALHAAAALTRARLVRPARPDRYARAVAAVARWGQTYAGGYAAAAALYPGDRAVIDEHGTLTFAQLHERTNRLAGVLADQGIGVGKQVAVMCRNHSGFVETLIATSKLGADALLLDTALGERELGELVKRERPRAVVYDTEFAEPLALSLRRRKAFIAWHEPTDRCRHRTLEELIAHGDSTKPVPAGHSAGSTSLASAKAATPPSESRGSSMAAALAVLEVIPLHSRGRVLVAAPLSAEWGLTSFSLAALLASGLVLRRQFDPEATLAAIERERVTCCAVDAAMLSGILELPAQVRKRYDTSSLRCVPMSGGPLADALAMRFMDEYGDVLYTLFGTGEAGWVTIARPADLRRAPGTAGRPLRHTTVRILDERDVPVRAGQTGRIFVANEMLRQGGADRSTQALGGLIATGEKGYLDDHGRLSVERAAG
jgi:acyl-coenzyme A synthetase/AMP-(fatty) acid ligase